MNPFPAAWTIIKNNEEEITAKIYAVRKEMTPHRINVGQIIATKKDLKSCSKKRLHNH